MSERIACRRCGGNGYTAEGNTDTPEQIQCEACSGSGTGGVLYTQEEMEQALSSMKRERDGLELAAQGGVTILKERNAELKLALSQRDAALEQVKVARGALEGMLALADLIGQADEGLPNRWNTNGRFLIHQSQMKDCFDQYQAAKSALATLDTASLRPQATGEKV